MSLRHFVRHTALGRLVLIPARLGWAWTHALRQAAQMIKDTRHRSLSRGVTARERESLSIWLLRS